MPYSEQKARTRAVARWRAANPERNRKIQAKWRTANPELIRELNKKWKAANPERAREHSRKGCAKYRAANLDRLRERDRELAVKRRAANPEITRKACLSRHGLTIAEYDIMVAAQGNRCAICEADKPGRNSKHWYVDHCHKTKVVRKLLCHNCNLGLGHFKDNVNLLQRAIDYLTTA